MTQTQNAEVSRREKELEYKKKMKRIFNYEFVAPIQRLYQTFYSQILEYLEKRIRRQSPDFRRPVRLKPHLPTKHFSTPILYY
jgi:hypothetical protein